MIYAAAVVATIVFVLIFALILSPPTQWIGKMTGEDEDDKKKPPQS